MTDAQIAAAARALESELLAHGITARSIQMWAGLKPHVTPTQPRGVLTFSLKPRKIGRKVRVASGGLWGPQVRACPVGGAISAIRNYHEQRALDLREYSA